jgi:hypothetical protein
MTINNRRRVRVNDVELNIVTQGEGPAVLLVHGFPDAPFGLSICRSVSLACPAALFASRIAKPPFYITSA